MHEHEENKSKLVTTKQGKATVISVWCRWMADYCYLLYTNDHFQHDPFDWNKLHSLSSWINLTWAASVCCQHSQYWYLGDYIHGSDSLVWLSQLLNCKYMSLINKGSEEDTIIGCIPGVLCWLADLVKLSAGLQSTVPAWTTLTVWSAITTRVMPSQFADCEMFSLIQWLLETFSWFAVHCTSMNNTNSLISNNNKGYAFSICWLWNVQFDSVASGNFQLVCSPLYQHEQHQQSDQQ